MLARNETIFKWALYSAAAVLCLLLQNALLQRFTIWGVIPFLYPMLAAIPATYEDPAPATVFALAMGVVCDLLLPEAIPCFYTLVFPLTGLTASLLAKSILPAGFLCSLAATAITFLATGVFHCALLLDGNSSQIWASGMFLSLREFCVSAPLIFPVTLLFRWVHHRTHWDD